MLGAGTKVKKEEFFRQISDQLEGLDYTELYKAYSGSIRKTQVEPRILFELLVYAYSINVFSTRKIEGPCRNYVQFLLVLDGHEPPDHTTLARFRSCKAKDLNSSKELEICWEMAHFRQRSLCRITTTEGKLLRVNRSIQSEGSFGQLKNNRNFKRFLTGGNVKILTELSLLALSQNIVKYISKYNKNRCKTHLLHPKALLNF